ncbi:MAG TPA: dual specificity protein phosphatase family protein [Acidobacteriota bacterium]
MKALSAARASMFLSLLPGSVTVAACYAIGTLAMCGLAFLGRPWTAIFLWPALSLAVVTVAYCGAGAKVFRKKEGYLPLSGRILLAPYLFGQQLSLAYYRRQCRPWDVVIPGVWMGRKLTDKEAAEALRHGVTSVLDLTAEFSESSPFLEITRRHIPILDLTGPTQNQLREAVAFIAEQSNRGTVYVHCKVGYSRSAAVLGAYLLANGFATTVEAAVDRLRLARPSLVVRREAWKAMREFAALSSPALTEPRAAQRAKNSLQSHTAWPQPRS